jgi:hypothetical protein
LNRVIGRNAEDSEPKNKPGRPATSKKGTPLDAFDPASPRSVIAVDGNKLLAGSVLGTRLPDDSIRWFVLLGDVHFDILGDTPGET